MKDFWNERYASTEYVYGKEPNQYFKQILCSLSPGKILLPAEGEGRNAVYAASLGWQVYAYDFSERAYKKAMALAAEKKVRLHYEIGSLAEMNYPDCFFDVIGLIYVHFPEPIRKSNHKHLTKMLAPEGNLILEAFSKKHPHYQKLNPNVGGPKLQSQLYDTKEIREDFKNFYLHQLEEEIVELHEGIFHVGKASVIRMHGSKKFEEG